MDLICLRALKQYDWLTAYAFTATFDLGPENYIKEVIKRNFTLIHIEDS